MRGFTDINVKYASVIDKDGGNGPPYLDTLSPYLKGIMVMKGLILCLFVLSCFTFGCEIKPPQVNIEIEQDFTELFQKCKDASLSDNQCYYFMCQAYLPPLEVKEPE